MAAIHFHAVRLQRQGTLSVRKKHNTSLTNLCRREGDKVCAPSAHEQLHGALPQLETAPMELPDVFTGPPLVAAVRGAQHLITEDTSAHGPPLVATVRGAQHLITEDTSAHGPPPVAAVRGAQDLIRGHISTRTVSQR